MNERTLIRLWSGIAGVIVVLLAYDRGSAISADYVARLRAREIQSLAKEIAALEHGYQALRHANPHSSGAIRPIHPMLQSLIDAGRVPFDAATDFS